MLLLSSPGYWSVGRVLWLIFGMGIALVLVIGSSVPAQAAPSRTYAVTDSVTVGSNPAGVTAMPGGDVYVAAGTLGGVGADASAVGD